MDRLEGCASKHRVVVNLRLGHLVNLRDQVWPVGVVQLGVVADEHLVQVLDQEEVARFEDQHIVVHLCPTVHAQRHLVAHAVLEIASKGFCHDEVGVNVDASPLQDDQKPDKVGLVGISPVLSSLVLLHPGQKGVHVLEDEVRVDVDDGLGEEAGEVVSDSFRLEGSSHIFRFQFLEHLVSARFQIFEAPGIRQISSAGQACPLLPPLPSLPSCKGRGKQRRHTF